MSLPAAQKTKLTRAIRSIYITASPTRLRLYRHASSLDCLLRCTNSIFSSPVLIEVLSHCLEWPKCRNMNGGSPRTVTPVGMKRVSACGMELVSALAKHWLSIPCGWSQKSPDTIAQQKCQRIVRWQCFQECLTLTFSSIVVRRRTWVVRTVVRNT